MIIPTPSSFLFSDEDIPKVDIIKEDSKVKLPNPFGFIPFVLVGFEKFDQWANNMLPDWNMANKMGVYNGLTETERLQLTCYMLAMRLRHYQTHPMFFVPSQPITLSLSEAMAANLKGIPGIPVKDPYYDDAGEDG